MNFQKIYNVVAVVLNNNHNRVCGHLAAMNNDIFEYSIHW